MIRTTPISIYASGMYLNMGAFLNEIFTTHTQQGS